MTKYMLIGTLKYGDGATRNTIVESADIRFSMNDFAKVVVIPEREMDLKDYVVKKGVQGRYIECNSVICEDTLIVSEDDSLKAMIVAAEAHHKQHHQWDI